MKGPGLRQIYRTLTKNKSALVINLVGLSCSFVFVMAISLWVYDELGMDKFHSWDKQLYQVIENHQTPDGIITQPGTPDLLASNLKVELPDVLHSVAVMQAEMLGDFTLLAENTLIKAGGQFAEPDFFEVFSFKLDQGNKKQVLSKPNSIVISKKLALSLFSNTSDVIGKTVEWSVFNYSHTATVSGVFEGIPSNSTAKFEFVLSFDSWLNFSEAIGRKVQWNNHAPYTYLVLNNDVNLKDFNEKVTSFYHSKSSAAYISMFAVPFSRQYLYGTYENGVQTGGRIAYVRLFTIIGLLILIIAGINFINLTTACAFQRFKETGIRTLLGSGRKRLVLQFMGEALLVGLISLVIAFGVLGFFLPRINQLTGKTLESSFTITFILGMVAICMITSLLSGIYPAIYLTGVRLSDVLKVKSQRSAASAGLRNSLVVVQFGVSVVLVLSVLFIYRQINFIQNKDLGYRKENVVMVRKEGGLFQNAAAFTAELRKIPEVVHASALGGNLMASFSTTDDVEWSGKNSDDKTKFEMLAVDYGLFETMEIPVTEGRIFSEEFGNESGNIILNQAAVKAMGLQPPVAGQYIRFWGKEKQIIGVCSDFHFESLHEEIRPLLIQYEPERTLNFMIRLEAGREVEALAEIEKIHAEFNPGVVFDFQFLDSAYNNLYSAERQMASVAPFFAAIGILLSCLGLFGLSVFAAGQRIKEIGVRKVNGARVSEILFMLNRDFIKWVLVACLLAFPLAWIALNRWLESFAYKTPLSWWIFALAGFLTIGIAVLTVSWQSWKAATRNPVEALRYE